MGDNKGPGQSGSGHEPGPEREYPIRVVIDKKCVLKGDPYNKHAFK